MLVEAVHVRGVRSIEDSGRMELGPITLIIGANNSGKSAFLRALMMGHGSTWESANTRIDSQAARVELWLSDTFPRHLFDDPMANLSIKDMRLSIEGAGPGSNGAVTHAAWNFKDGSAGAARAITIPHARPHHLIVPILTRGRAAIFETVVDADAAATVGLDDRSLASRLNALTGEHPEGRRYREAMRRVLDLNVATFPVRGGSSPGIPLSTSAGIGLDRMGDGVRNITTLISELVDTAQPRLFLIEEPENDLHPGALLGVLEEIRQHARHHQFVVTTHSDVVLRELGSVANARLYRTNISSPDGSDGLPTTTFEPLDDELKRRDALIELGYQFDLPFAWLILEESTAQTFIGACLIPRFAPRMAAVQLIAAHGVGDVPRTVAAFHRMVLFTRLADRDVPRSWVLVDGDDPGRKMVIKLKKDFKSWPAGRFSALSEPDIENYYPKRFAERVAAIHAATGEEERKLKAELVKDVVAWAATEADGDQVRRELEETASDLLEHLRRIEAELPGLAREARTPNSTAPQSAPQEAPSAGPGGTGG